MRQDICVHMRDKRSRFTYFESHIRNIPQWVCVAGWRNDLPAASKIVWTCARGSLRGRPSSWSWRSLLLSLCLARSGLIHKCFGKLLLDWEEAPCLTYGSGMKSTSYTISIFVVKIHHDESLDCAGIQLKYFMRENTTETPQKHLHKENLRLVVPFDLLWREVAEAKGRFQCDLNALQIRLESVRLGV